MRNTGRVEMTIANLTEGELEPKLLRAQGPTVLDFYQASCPPRRVLEPRLERIAAQYADEVPVYRVDIDRDLAVAECFGVMSLPTVSVFQSGEEIERLDGLITDAQLKAAFERATGR
jgi:thioredoxin 1